ncbi:hypothetical protein TNCT_441331 [Trichonephila clavata]|uniref:Uncharacterized protein n=1 Tax=Trichonephila clavata TaxID=2740835 RepID=A0A8X6FN51_TRICU|nr:hypothetical protein TNCT_441331 [Trichonephila clavata]
MFGFYVVNDFLMSFLSTFTFLKQSGMPSALLLSAGRKRQNVQILYEHLDHACVKNKSSGITENVIYELHPVPNVFEIVFIPGIVLDI